METKQVPWLQYKRVDSEDHAGPLAVHNRTTHVRLGPACWVHTRPRKVLDRRNDERLDVRDKNRVVLGVVGMAALATAGAGLVVRRFRKG